MFIHSETVLLFPLKVKTDEIIRYYYQYSSRFQQTCYDSGSSQQSTSGPLTDTGGGSRPGTDDFYFLLRLLRSVFGFAVGGDAAAPQD